MSQKDFHYSMTEEEVLRSMRSASSSTWKSSPPKPKSLSGSHVQSILTPDRQVSPSSDVTEEEPLLQVTLVCDEYAVQNLYGPRKAVMQKARIISDLIEAQNKGNPDGFVNGLTTHYSNLEKMFNGVVKVSEAVRQINSNRLKSVPLPLKAIVVTDLSEDPKGALASSLQKMAPYFQTLTNSHLVWFSSSVATRVLNLRNLNFPLVGLSFRLKDGTVVDGMRIFIERVIPVKFQLGDFALHEGIHFVVYYKTTTGELLKDILTTRHYATSCHEGRDGIFATYPSPKEVFTSLNSVHAIIEGICITCGYDTIHDMNSGIITGRAVEKAHSMSKMLIKGTHGLITSDAFERIDHENRSNLEKYQVFVSAINPDFPNDVIYTIIDSTDDPERYRENREESKNGERSQNHDSHRATLNERVEIHTPSGSSDDGSFWRKNAQQRVSPDEESNTHSHQITLEEFSEIRDKIQNMEEKMDTLIDLLNTSISKGSFSGRSDESSPSPELRREVKSNNMFISQSEMTDLANVSSNPCSFITGFPNGVTGLGLSTAMASAIIGDITIRSNRNEGKTVGVTPSVTQVDEEWEMTDETGGHRVSMEEVDNIEVTDTGPTTHSSDPTMSELNTSKVDREDGRDDDFDGIVAEDPDTVLVEGEPAIDVCDEDPPFIPSSKEEHSATNRDEDETLERATEPPEEDPPISQQVDSRRGSPRQEKPEEGTAGPQEVDLANEEVNGDVQE